MNHKDYNIEQINNQINNLYHLLDTTNNSINSLISQISLFKEEVVSNNNQKKKKEYNNFEKKYNELQNKRLDIHKELIKYNNLKEEKFNSLKNNMSVSTDDIYLCNSSPIKHNV